MGISQNLFSLHLPIQHSYILYLQEMAQLGFLLSTYASVSACSNPRQWSCTVTHDFLKDALPTELQGRG